MSLSTHTTPSGYLLPSIHSAPPFFTLDTLFNAGFALSETDLFLVRQQPNPTTKSIITEQWIRLILTYARHKKLSVLRVEDAETVGNDWEEILFNERINRKMLPAHLSDILATMVGKNIAAYEPVKQTREVLVYWRLPEEWAEVLYDWASSSGQLNTILTFYDITDPPIESPLTNIPITLLRKAIVILGKTGRSQIIAIPDGEGVRFLARSK